eukprot:2059385-Rhodomonas_salina.1
MELVSPAEEHQGGRGEVGEANATRPRGSRKHAIEGWVNGLGTGVRDVVWAGGMKVSDGGGNRGLGVGERSGMLRGGGRSVYGGLEHEASGGGGGQARLRPGWRRSGGCGRK